MDINYELYKVFYYVASSLSFSDASKKLFISQSAVSQSIKTLERKLGQPLFIRSTKKVQLTPAGALLLKHVEPAMNLISRGESQLLESGSLGLGQLHIGASDTICRYFLLPYLQKFHRKFPDVPIKITNASSMGCVDLLEQRRVDLIITNFPNPHLNPSYIQKTVGSFSDVFVANPAYFDLADRIVPFSELGTYPLMMLDRKSTTSEFLHHIFLQHQLELLPQVEQVKDKGYEILYFTENVDEFAVRMMQSYQEKEFQSVLDSKLDLDSEEEKKALEEKQEASKDMLEAVKKALEGKVGNVKLSGHLKSHPVCLSSEGDLSMEMAKTLNAMPGSEGQKLQAQTVLEINPEHAIYQKLMDMQADSSEQLDDYAKLLYDQALLIAGMPIEDPVAFSNRICKLM